MQRRSFLETLGAGAGLAVLGLESVGCGPAREEAGQSGGWRQLRAEIIPSAEEHGHTLHGVLVRRSGLRLHGTESRFADPLSGRIVSGILVHAIPGFGDDNPGQPRGHLIQYWNGAKWLDITLAWHEQTVVAGARYRVLVTDELFVFPLDRHLSPADAQMILEEERWALGV